MMAMAAFETPLFLPFSGCFSQSPLVYINEPEGLVVSEIHHVVITANIRVNKMVRPAVLKQKFQVAVVTKTCNFLHVKQIM
jgi:hypothetical protein